MKQMNLILTEDVQKLLERRLIDAGVQPVSIERRGYPEETIFIVRVSERQYLTAGRVGNAFDRELANANFNGFVTVRKEEGGPRRLVNLVDGVADSRASELSNLIAARSRTSEIQPSLEYIPDTAKNIELVLAPRHQLIFGRRGAGKTALLVEAKKRALEKSDVTAWINLQTLRLASARKAYVFVCQRLCDAIQAFYSSGTAVPRVLGTIASLQERLETASSNGGAGADDLVPEMQQVLKRFSDIASVRFYIFIDELHYLNVTEQPSFLDMVHGSARDCNVWLKIAGIRHLSRWFQAHPALGLQSGHDADHIDLDLTLENPKKAKTFLEAILDSYARRSGIRLLSSLFSKPALDRLVLASGAVPRDFLVLSAGAIREAQQRENAKVVGVQDVNKAAGEAARIKLTELEDDAASISGDQIKGALNLLRRFCLDTKRYTYFRIDLRDKEANGREYSFVQDLMDLRLLHLIDSSLSDEREAGRRSEVYMLDLSQFSGQRLKKQLRVLDFEDGHIVLKVTGTASSARRGATPKQRLGLLRRGPLFELRSLSARAEG